MSSDVATVRIPIFPGLVEVERVTCKPEGSSGRVKCTPSMGRSVFQEYPMRIAGSAYYFRQWKGVGTNRINVDLEATARSFGNPLRYPLGAKGFAPLFFMERKHGPMLRFRGGAFYEDLLREEQRNQQLAGLGFRVPVVLMTTKFTRAFSRANDLPCPQTDKSGRIAGETLSAYLQARKDRIDPALYRQLWKANDLKEGYRSAILGQNIRAFRNVWRVDDLESVLREPPSRRRTHMLVAILEPSRNILSLEMDRALSWSEFVRCFATLLDQQAAMLAAHRLVHRGFLRHKQDVTLAAELCDVDADDVSNASRAMLDRQTRALLAHVACVRRAVRCIS